MADDNSSLALCRYHCVLLISNLSSNVNSIDGCVKPTLKILFYCLPLNTFNGANCKVSNLTKFADEDGLITANRFKDENYIDKLVL